MKIYFPSHLFFLNKNSHRSFVHSKASRSSWRQQKKFNFIEEVESFFTFYGLKIERKIFLTHLDFDQVTRESRIQAKLESSNDTRGGFVSVSTPFFLCVANLLPHSWEDFIMTKEGIANGWLHWFNQLASQFSFPSFAFFPNPQNLPPNSQISSQLPSFALLLAFF